MNRRHLMLYLIILLVLPCLTSCTASTKESTALSDPYTATGFYFDTVVSIQVYDGDAKETAEGCLALCSKYENLFSTTIETSDTARINSSDGKPVEVSDDTAVLITTALKFSRLTDGKFDITAAPLSVLWGFQGDDPSLPDQASIDEALSHVDYSSVSISGNTVTLDQPAISVDFGGIAKGYIGDRLKDYILESGSSHALINLGGNVVTVGGKPDGTAFTIGLQRPFSLEGTALLSIKASDWSVVSSGPYERYFEENGKRYHHIMDTSTGYPVDNNLYGVTILTRDSVSGDALSTGCFALGLDKGMELINSLPDTYAVFITDDYTVHYSDGFENEFHPQLID